MNFEVNPNCSAKVRRVGLEQTPVLVIDNFLRDTQALIEFAEQKAHFAPDPNNGYPGVRATLPKSYVETTVEAVFPALQGVHKISSDRTVTAYHPYFSLVCSEPNSLVEKQRLPHFDSLENNYFALIHYIGNGQYGGTGLFRHKATHFESITASNIRSYKTQCEVEEAIHGPHPARYIAGSTERYELYHELEYSFNRVVVYPGNLLHSGLIRNPNDICSDPKKGRLTTNIFLEFR